MAIYKPTGGAAEYCDEFAANLYQGCTNGCIYCYVPRTLRMSKQEFHSKDIPREDILRIIEKDLEKGRYEGKHVFLCFTCDPYQVSELMWDVTRETLKLFIRFKVIPVILTKGSLALRDVKLLQEAGAWCGVTLTLDNKMDSLKWEPNAALPEKRIEILKEMHKADIKTWVSLEPVIDPEQSLNLIDLTHQFVYMYKVGKMNYFRLPHKVDWHKFAVDVVARLKKYNKPYYIKKSLGEYLI